MTTLSVWGGCRGKSASLWARSKPWVGDSVQPQRQNLSLVVEEIFRSNARNLRIALFLFDPGALTMSFSCRDGTLLIRPH